METILKKVRKEKGLMQVQVAEKANVSIRAYQNYETSKRIPDVHTAQRIADVLGIENVKDIFPLLQQNDTTEKQ